MASEVGRTLVRLSIVRTLMRHGSDTERPIRRYRVGDGEIIEKLVLDIRAGYRARLLEMRTDGKAGTPDFQNIKHLILNAQAKEKRWEQKTINFYSSVISTFFALTDKKPDEITVTINELEIFGQTFLRENKMTRQT